MMNDNNSQLMTINDHNEREQPPKRARYMSQWESSLFNKDPSTPGLRLQDLFDGRRWQPQQQSRSCGPLTSSCGNNNNQKKGSNNTVVTFRLEHREGGPLATHPGEERILLFRSDQKGSIAKIIFSSEDSTTSDDDVETHAKIHVLDVKDQYRGFDLGGLLFCEALQTLQHRSTGKSVRCELDAEEDVRRHNKLVGFYSRLGCVVKPNAKPQFLNNNDGETYRKVPMQIDLQGCNEEEKASCLESGFVPIVLLGSRGRKGKLRTSNNNNNNNNNLSTSSTQPHHWVISEDGTGHVQFRTTHGRYLTIDPEGRCLEQDEGAPSEDHKSSFQLLRVSDHQQYVLSGENSNNDEESIPSSENELWVILSPYGTFLHLDRTSLNLEGSKTPSFWQSNSGDLSLTCTSDTPPRRQHYRQSWIQQTVDYVQTKKKQYQEISSIRRMTLQEALHRVQNRRAFPLRMDAASRNLSLRSLCYQTAEAARAAGHPDWVQFVALVHALGGVVHCTNGMDDTLKSSTTEEDYDWTIPCTSRVVGCASPATATFAEFKELNRDEHDERYNSLHGMYSPHCGLANVHLTWTGPEYLWTMLQHNNVDLPPEGFAVLRLFSLSDWHTNYLYDHLANEEDYEIQSFVADFDQLREQAQQVCLSSKELTDTECDRLWESHYAAIAAKFGADDVLDW